MSKGRSAPFHPPFEASTEYLRTEPKFRGWKCTKSFYFLLISHPRAAFLPLIKAILIPLAPSTTTSLSAVNSYLRASSICSYLNPEKQLKPPQMENYLRAFHPALVLFPPHLHFHSLNWFQCRFLCVRRPADVWKCWKRGFKRKKLVGCGARWRRNETKVFAVQNRTPSGIFSSYLCRIILISVQP